MNAKKKRMFGIGSIVAGAVLIVFSMIIKGKVSEGEGQIAQAERGQGLLNKSPYTKPFGDRMGAKIGEGKDDIAYYTKVANILMGAGIVLIVVGGGSMFFVRKS